MVMLLNKSIPPFFILNKVKYDIMYVLMVSSAGLFITDRWWESLKVRDSIVNDPRSFVIQQKTLVARGNETAVRKISLRRVAWYYSLGQSLRGLNPTAGLENLTSEEEMEEIRQHNNKSLALLSLHGNDIRELKEEDLPRPFQPEKFYVL